jgi:hypothetical protein
MTATYRHIKFKLTAVSISVKILEIKKILENAKGLKGSSVTLKGCIVKNFQFFF